MIGTKTVGDVEVYVDDAGCLSEERTTRGGSASARDGLIVVVDVFETAAHVADITDLEDKILGQLMLDLEVVLLGDAGTEVRID